MVYSLSNINNYQDKFSIIKKSRVIGTNSKTTYTLLESLSIELSNGDIIDIPKRSSLIVENLPTQKCYCGLRK